MTRSITTPEFLKSPPRHLFFTGKGGVGKTSIACATAITLADAGRRVLLVSTDPASNLDEMLQTPLSSEARAIEGVPRLFALNIDPERAAEAYRVRVLEQLDPASGTARREEVREQLSGACTTEVAAFDEFADLLAERDTRFDHVIFDTAPTGHTLRLLSLPAAWTGFLEANEAGASCLGPHSGLKMQQERFHQAMVTLGDRSQTEIIMVTRADKSALAEAARSSTELAALGLTNQRLVVNGVFHASTSSDVTASAIEASERAALANMPEPLKAHPREEIALRSFDMVGLAALRALLNPADEPATGPAKSQLTPPTINPEEDLRSLIDQLSAREHGLIMVMGKGGVGKTTVAAAIAIGLVSRGHAVHLSTTDPAAHLQITLAGDMPKLTVDRIDPRLETERYIARIMETRGRNLDDAGRALLREDLRSPCTEEVAVFHVFSRVVAEARSNFVVLDTAPTGHTLLLMDAAGAYHRQMTHDLAEQKTPGRMITPLMRLQDPSHTQVLLVTLLETTPVSEAAALQQDLRRAGIEPFAWVMNRGLTGSGTSDPLLRKRMQGEATQISRIRSGLARRCFQLPWQATPPVGIETLKRLANRT
jgi:arsenite/tail-anchored protein-transporting ATPase